MVDDSVDLVEVSNSDDFSMAQLPGDDAPRKMSVLDLIDPSVPRADKATRDARMAICRGCEYFQAGTLCSVCHCVMKFKTWLGPAECPLHEPKWVAVS